MIKHIPCKRIIYVDGIQKVRSSQMEEPLRLKYCFSYLQFTYRRDASPDSRSPSTAIISKFKCGGIFHQDSRFPVSGNFTLNDPGLESTMADKSCQDPETNSIWLGSHSAVQVVTGPGRLFTDTALCVSVWLFVKSFMASLKTCQKRSLIIFLSPRGFVIYFLIANWDSIFTTQVRAE